MDEERINEGRDGEQLEQACADILTAEDMAGDIEHMRQRKTKFYRKQARAAHPDKGGTSQEFQALKERVDACTKAIDARAARRGRLGR